MCFVDLEKVIERVPRKVLVCAANNKGILEVLVRLVMREQRQESGWIQSCQRRLRLNWRMY